MKVVLDTNVLISGIFFSGPPSEILKAWRRGGVQIVLSREIVDEYVRVAAILAKGFPLIDANSILTLIITQSKIIPASPLPHRVCDDPDDDKFLACAVAGACKFIVSGDRHLLKVSGHRGIEVVTPRVFVDRYLARGA